MGFSFWITKARSRTLRICNTYCYPQQKWLRERSSILCSYLHCFSCSYL